MMSEHDSDQRVSSWPALFRRYLALRQDQDFAAAVDCAPPEIAEFLAICAGGDAKAADERIARLRDRLAGRPEELLTVELSYSDIWAVLCQDFRKYPSQQQEKALSTGLDVCQGSVLIAQKLGDLPCVALYSGVAASGFRSARQLGRAEAASNAACHLYLVLSERDP